MTGIKFSRDRSIIASCDAAAGAIQSAVAQSPSTPQLSTTNIVVVLAEVFTADNWENRQVDAFSGLCEDCGNWIGRRVIIVCALGIRSRSS